MTLTTANVSVEPSFPLGRFVNTDQTLVFSSAGHNGISVGDSDDDHLSVTLAVSHGVITLASLSGLTITGGADGTSTVTVSGLVSNINAALEGLSYHPHAGYGGSDALLVTASDGVLTDTKTINLVVDPVNSVPVAGDDDVGVRTDFVAISSSLTFNDSDSDGDAFLISGAEHNLARRCTTTMAFIPSRASTGRCTFLPPPMLR